MKKNLANILTSTRIALALVLVFYHSLNTSWLVLYVICGLTDFLDGPIARATHSESTLGAKLDTTGDVLMYLALGKILLMECIVKVRFVLYFLIPLFMMFVSALISLAKFHDFLFIHTGLAKALGMGLFFLPFFAFFGFEDQYLRLVYLIALLGGIEMITIQLFLNHPDADILFLRDVKKSNLRYTEEEPAERNYKAS